VEATVAASDPASLRKISHLGFIANQPPPSNPSTSVVKKQSLNYLFCDYIFSQKKENNDRIFLFY